MILRWFTDRNIHTDEPLNEYNIIKTGDMKYSWYGNMNTTVPSFNEFETHFGSCKLQYKSFFYISIKDNITLDIWIPCRSL